MTDTAGEKAAAAEEAPKAEKTPMKKNKAKEEANLLVTGPARGRRRVGHSFGATPVALRVADLSDDELAAIKGDPQLVAATEMRPEEAAAGDA